MSIPDGHAAIIRRIVAGVSGNVVLPNGPGKGLPRFVVQEAGAGQQPADLSGATRAFPEVTVRVETSQTNAQRQPAYSTEAADMIRQITALFRPGQQFDGVKIDRAPDVRPAIPSTGIYSVPVVIRATIVF